MRLLRKLLGGKGDRKVAVVFGSSAPECHRAVVHLAQGALRVPVWLFCTQSPLPETAALCQRVSVAPNPLSLLRDAARQLASRWVALAVAPWTGQGRGWLLKLAPFLWPPFRVLVMNEHGDFFAASPAPVVRHVGRRVRDRFHSLHNACRDLQEGYWLLLTYHIWRSGPVRRVQDETAAFLLLVAASVLRWTGHPHRWIFHHLPGQRLLELNTAETADAGAGLATVDRFCQQRPVWDGAALEDFARRSRTRWILWRERPDAAVDCDDLLPLLQTPRAFAASPQTHFRAWKPSLLPTAPFRALQPGEACPLLAPLSHAILVDRAKLLALGIPRCSLPGAAWMLLFWKAAAAGWRSYSLGQRQPPAQQPDFPLQEAAVFLRVSASRPWRQLAPAEPSLVRGNIACAPALQRQYRPAAARPKVLLVSPFLPYPLSHGGAVRIYNLCRALAGRVDFLLAAMRESHETVDYAKLHEVFQQVWVVDRDEAPSRDTRLPAQVRQYQSQAMRALIADLAARWKPDALQIEYTHMAGLRDAAPDIPAVLVEHDLTFSLYRQLAERNPADRPARREYWRWLAFEQHWLKQFNAVWTVSEEDRRAAIGVGDRDPQRTYTIANGVDLDRFQPTPHDGPDPEILYVGSFRHLPNFLGFEKLRTEIMPRLWKRFPELRLRVVAGPQHDRFWQQFAPPGGRAPVDRRIVVHGFVEDLRPLYARATVAAVPLEVSAGTNIKVMEAMASGRAVVTTPVGCAGLDLEDGHDALIRAEAAAFAEALAELLSNDRLRLAMAARARHTVEQRFGWQAIGEAAFRSYLALGTGEFVAP
ncbi:MAG TPA: glycosyltransferase family 4 protein [Bryobacteraceae bacterium]|nr:glycosyltransferase family 4 protein [Bryobacteraceae bacterium]